MLLEAEAGVSPGRSAVRSPLRRPAGLGAALAPQRGAAPLMLRMGVSAWRVGSRPQPAASRRTMAATSGSGTPTGQAAAAASKSGSSPAMSDDASPTRA
jgi:hypothetical protein